MDNPRGLDSDISPLDGLEEGYITEDDDAAMERPPAIGADERRMQVRAYNFWTQLLGANRYPLIADLDPENALDFGEHGVLLHFQQGVENPSVPYVGSAIAEECGLDRKIGKLAAVPPRSLLSRITDHYMQILANKAPIGFEAEFVNQRGATILYRGIMLPFSSDGATIDFIYGVINWKEAAPEEEAEKLRCEVEESFASLRDDDVAMPAWADGPASGESLPVPDLVKQPILTRAEGEAVAPEDVVRPGENDGLVRWLQAARSAAAAAALAEQRSRRALYEAVGMAYDVALLADREPEDFAAMLAEAGIKPQARAPYTPLVKLIFGANYEKTRVAEIAMVIAHARALGVAFGAAARWIAEYEGGIKAILKTARTGRQQEGNGAARDRRAAARRESLRSLPARPLSDFADGESEFVLLVARRGEDGAVELIGALEDERNLTEKALEKLPL